MVKLYASALVRGGIEPLLVRDVDVEVAVADESVARVISGGGVALPVAVSEKPVDGP